MSGDIIESLYRDGNRRDSWRRVKGGFHPVGGRALKTVINRLSMQFGIDSDGEWEEQFGLAIEKTGYVVTDEIKNSVGKAIDTCDSPIEKHLFPWLLVQRHWFFDYPTVLMSRDRLRCNCNAIGLVPQLWIGQFRVDFALVWWHGQDLMKVVIECDGAEHHEDEEKDLKRSKNLLRISHVLGIVRFTGSEIYANPEKCAYLAAAEVHGCCNLLRMKERK